MKRQHNECKYVHQRIQSIYTTAFCTNYNCTENITAYQQRVGSCCAVEQHCYWSNVGDRQSQPMGLIGQNTELRVG